MNYQQLTHVARHLLTAASVAGLLMHTPQAQAARGSGPAPAAPSNKALGAAPANSTAPLSAAPLVNANKSNLLKNETVVAKTTPSAPPALENIPPKPTRKPSEPAKLKNNAATSLSPAAIEEMRRAHAVRLENVLILAKACEDNQKAVTGRGPFFSLQGPVYVKRMDECKQSMYTHFADAVGLLPEKENARDIWDHELSDAERYAIIREGLDDFAVDVENMQLNGEPIHEIDKINYLIRRKNLKALDELAASQKTIVNYCIARTEKGYRKPAKIEGIRCDNEKSSSDREGR